MCKTREQPVHKVSDNPYQTSDSLFIEYITQEVDQINQVYCKQVYSFKLETGALVNSFTHILPTWVY